MRWLAFGTACALVASACSLDMTGLGAAASGDDASSTVPDGGDADERESADQDSESPFTEDGAVTAEASMDADAPVGDGPADAPPGEGGTSTVCDEDGDGYKAMTGGCGGNDCCDSDAHVHPGQTSYFTGAGACGSFDYDCDGKDTAEYGAASCSWSSFSCSGDGFAAPVPQCGDFGTFTSCSMPWYDVFTCDGSNGSQAQACR